MTHFTEVTMPRAAKRPISVNRGREQIRRLTAQRTEYRDARLHAEAWYQALHTWNVRFATTGTVSISYAAFRPESHFEPLTMGESGPPQKSFLMTPVGEVIEAEVGRIITDMALSAIPETVQLGRMLDRLRRQDSGCMDSLLRGTSWSQHRERAVRYALAVLTLAVRLGDVQAEGPLQRVRAELSQLGLVNPVQSM